MARKEDRLILNCGFRWLSCCASMVVVVIYLVCMSLQVCCRCSSMHEI